MVKTVRILHLVTWIVRGGIEMWLVNLLNAVPRHEFHMDVCCKGKNVGTLASDVRDTGALLYHCRLRPTMAGFVSRLSRILREGKYDILHNHIGGYSGLGVMAARRARVPVITTFHSTQFAPQESWSGFPVLRQLRAAFVRRSVEYAIRHSQWVTGVSHGVLHSLVRNATPANQRVLYLGIAPERFLTPVVSDIRGELGWPAHCPIVLHVGRFIAPKNHAGVVSVFSDVLSAIPKAKLLLVGDGPLKGNVDQLIRDRGLHNSARIISNRSDVPDIMKQSTVFFLPSTYEGFGLAAIEASAARLPVVATDVVGLNEAVEDAETGFLHPVDDHSSLVNSLRKLIGDSELRSRMGEAGRRRAVANFSFERCTAELLSLYRECAEHSSSSQLVAT